MPSKVELDLIYQNLVSGKTDKYNFNGKMFWSSSAFNSDDAWKQRFSDGNQNNNNKNNTNSVRAVRDFAQRQAQADVKICLCHFGIYFMDNFNCLKNEQKDFPVSIEDVFEAYYECRKHKRNKSGALEFEVNLEENFIIIVNDNEMSISENQGGLYQNLKELRDSNGACQNNFFKTFGLTDSVLTGCSVNY